VVVTNNVNSLTSYEAALTVANDPGTRAAKIGVNFLGDGVDTTATLLTSVEEAGVVPQTNWNNINCNVANTPACVGISNPLLNSAGNLTAVQLEFLANDAWNSDGPSDTANDKLMKGILKEGNGFAGSTMTLTFWNLAPAFYDVYVYGNVNDGPANLSVSIGAATYAWIEPAAFNDATGFTDASDPFSGGFGNYVKYRGATPVNGAITLSATYLSGSDGLGIAGLQLVSSAAFPTSPNLTAALQGNQLVLSWNSPLNFQLQYRTGLGQETWTNEPTVPVITGNQATVRLPAAGPARFFRLIITP